MSTSRLLLLLTILMLPAAAMAEESADEANDRIVFTVTGFKNDKGMLRCALFDETNWLGSSVRSVAAEIIDSRAVCEIESVPPGTYGISSYHDKNDNGRMERGAMGIPKEAYATSNDARGSFGPPKFEDAAFTYDGGRLELSAEMR